MASGAPDFLVTKFPTSTIFQEKQAAYTTFVVDTIAAGDYSFYEVFTVDADGAVYISTIYFSAKVQDAIHEIWLKKNGIICFQAWFTDNYILPVGSWYFEAGDKLEVYWKNNSASSGDFACGVFGYGILPGPGSTPPSP